MPHSETIAIDSTSAPFNRFKRIHRLGTDRSGHASEDHCRHQLYVARDKQSPVNVLIKLTSRPGLVYQRDLSNEIATLATVNRELPRSPFFPTVYEHGQLRDGRVYLITTLFEEFPLATAIGTERIPARTVAHLRTAIEVARALTELHQLNIFHVDLNPMNILRRAAIGQPVIRIVDFESSYETARHAAGEFYNPPTTPRYSAPEVCKQAPDARADLFSLGATLYSMLAGSHWTWEADAAASVEADRDLDPDLKTILLRAVDPDPRRRYRTMLEFHDALGGHLERIWPGRSW